MGSTSAKLSMDPFYNRMTKSFQVAIVDKALPAASQRMEPLAKEAFERLLPDGTESRKKQSKDVRRAFPHKMRENVRIKRLKDDRGVAFIAGTTVKVGQTHFDMGEKAKTVGRVHKLWGEELAENSPRIQRQQYQDIPEKVSQELEPVAEAIVLQEIMRIMGSV